MPTRPLAILGAGNAATALALLLAKKGRRVHLYCIEPDVEQDINERACNSKYLAGVSLPRSIRAMSSLEQAVHQAEVVILAVPSFASRDVMAAATASLAPDVVIASITKGLDPKTLRPIALEAMSCLPKSMQKRVCFIGGPAVANELAHHQPAAFFIAGKDSHATKKLAHLFHSPSLKVATPTDIEGTGLCMALKNVYAIALGMCDGLHYPMNSKALITAIAIEEMARILKASKANQATAYTLAGLGDLLVTGFSPHGRNRTYGEKIVGSDFKDPLQLGMGTVEGIAATKSSLLLIKKLHVEAPLLQTIGKCLRQTSHFEKPFIGYLKTLRLS